MLANGRCRIVTSDMVEHHTVFVTGRFLFLTVPKTSANNIKVDAIDGAIHTMRFSENSLRSH